MLPGYLRPVHCCFNDTVFHDGFWESQRSLCSFVLSESGFAHGSVSYIFHGSTSTNGLLVIFCDFIYCEWRLTSDRTVAHFIKSHRSQCLCCSFIFFTRVNPRKTQTIGRTGNRYFCSFSNTCTAVTVTVNIISEGDFFIFFSIMMETWLLGLKKMPISRLAYKTIHNQVPVISILHIFSQLLTYTFKRHARRWLDELYAPLAEKIGPFVYISFVPFIW